PGPVRLRGRRVRLDACSVLRSSAYRKYASSLRTLRARRDGPSSREGPRPAEESDSLRLSLRGFLTLPRHPDGFLVEDHFSIRPWCRWGGVEIRILNGRSEANP